MTPDNAISLTLLAVIAAVFVAAIRQPRQTTRDAHTRAMNALTPKTERSTR